MGQLTRFDKNYINSLIDRFSLSDYVETGTGESVSLKHAAECDFKHLWTVDLDEDWTRKAESLFPSDKLTVENSYSTDFLEKNIFDFRLSLFFLDAHFPFADFHKISYEESIRKYKDTAFPLEDEIKTLKKNKPLFVNSVIIIDDWILYDESCNCEWTQMGKSFEYRDLTQSLKIDLSPQAITKHLEKTHKIEIFTEHQGYLLATPK